METEAAHQTESQTVRMAGRLDPRGSWSANACSIGRALDVVGNRSALLLLREAFYGTTRFDDFATRVGSASRRRPPASASWWTRTSSSGSRIRKPANGPGCSTG